AISLGSVLVAIIGLWFMRRVLLRYFTDRVVAATLLILVLATNYLDYSAINGPMTHNYLFTLYALLIWLTIKFYERPAYSNALGIGLVLGLAALTRPTEIIAALIPILWGVGSRAQARERLAFFGTHWPKLALAAATVAVGSIQLIYWKYVSGDWIVYSYQDQGFSWLSPHIRNGLFSYRAGWLMYTPAMGFALLVSSPSPGSSGRSSRPLSYLRYCSSTSPLPGTSGGTAAAWGSAPWCRPTPCWPSRWRASLPGPGSGPGPLTPLPPFASFSPTPTCGGPIRRTGAACSPPSR
ncbi:MAG: glycosyltransferase family 39 protein, partial [Phaeodactylibacter sp.]|nr:glycosyltransferase family 39 protein [Phaeodactylibacter sp.]